MRRVVARVLRVAARYDRLSGTHPPVQCATEGCESGRIGWSRKPLWGNPPWVQIPLPPPRAFRGRASRPVPHAERCAVPDDDLRATVRAAVEARVPADDRERSARTRILAELEWLPSPFSEDGGPTHVTASAIVVGPKGTVLHVHRRSGAWLQPGGHLEPGETPAAAAVRESVE